MKNYRFFNTFLSLSLIALLLSGCGFKLRGDVEALAGAKEVTLVLKKTAPIQLQQSLERAFKRQNITLLENAPYRLVIEEIQENRRSITLDRKGNVDEYELLLLIAFSVLDDKDQPVSTPLVVRTERIYDYNADAATASFLLEQEIREEMWDTLTTRIVNQFSALTRQQ
ncbi:LPS assembly lipoprotein LptE [Neptunomonas concharum]|uniref:LPS-assembly lipoprotein LptE n=1 Tax=Neptunomonas concharum TaxID=1031538 RepID=A0A5P1R8R1_9GAMM|nr:LPS assembly lipoprotein LptE [Neptunomonas concharum]QEQ95675.1 hypothetical protein F0U83_02565 [Neptunomonas concharum]